MKKVNVLLSTYNGEKYLREQIESIIEQTYSEIELYIRDDGSTDKTRDIICEYAGMKRVHIFLEENIGFCPSFLRLLELSEEGDYWSFCDQDDIWKPDKIEKAVIWFEKQSKQIPMLYHSGFIDIDHDGNVIGEYLPGKYKYDFRKSLTSTYYYGFSMVINNVLRKMMLQCDGLKFQSHDWLAGMIVSAFGKAYFSPELESYHRIHGANASARSLVQKIRLGVSFLRGDMPYKKNAREFQRAFGHLLRPREKDYLAWFSSDKYKLRYALRKCFYPGRWNQSIFMEIVMRAFMLTGVL